MTAGAPITVLLVDDEPAIAESLAELLGYEGYLVRAASNGLEALDALRAGKVDLLLLDMMMPGLDGLQVAAAVRADPALAGVRIVLMSAAPLPRSGPRTWDATLAKPFDLDTLRRTLARALAGPAPPAGAGPP